MIDHITFGVVAFDRSAAFYDAALRPLGLHRLLVLPLEDTQGVKVAGYGSKTPCLWIAEERPTTGMMHVALRAPDRASIDAFYAAALSAGGRDNGPPGLRGQYHPDYYAAFVLDPDGHNIEAVCHAPPGAR